jgi:hypothetical protein
MKRQEDRKLPIKTESMSVEAKPGWTRPNDEFAWCFGVRVQQHGFMLRSAACPPRTQSPSGRCAHRCPAPFARPSGRLRDNTPPRFTQPGLRNNAHTSRLERNPRNHSIDGHRPSAIYPPLPVVHGRLPGRCLSSNLVAVRMTPAPSPIKHQSIPHVRVTPSHST